MQQDRRRPGRVFITGTDTEVGKTYVSRGLLQAAGRAGLSTVGLKPVAAGAEETAQGWHNEDALLLQQEASLKLSYEEVNPVCLKQAIAPHLAAAHEGRRIQVERLAGICRGVMLRRPDLTLVEGAGGWRVPLNDRERLSDLARLLEMPVILVVGMRLGCLNHALLSAEAILGDGLPLVGWVANQVDPQMACFEENRETLQNLLPAPLLASLPWRPDGSGCADAFDIAQIMPSLCP